MTVDKIIGVAVASTAAVAAGIYVYYRYSRRTAGEKAGSRLRRSFISTEKCGSLQRQYLDEFKEDLGNKSYFMGDELTSTDLKIFGQLASIYYVPKTDSVVGLINEEYPSLVAWMERVKQQLSRKDFKLAIVEKAPFASSEAIVAMSCCPCSLLVGAVVLFVFYKMFCGGKKKPKIHEKDYKKDRVYLYQFPRNSTLPNMSPYCLKIEAFLRLHKIDYENRYTLSQRSQHGLLPFVELNGEQIADSEIIEERLMRHFNLPITGSEYEDSVARATARLVSHHTTPILTKYKVLDETDDTVDDFIEVAGVPGYLHFLKPLAAWLFRRIATKKIKAILGLFSDSEFDMLLRKDLGALKGILGEKKFFLGDKISNVDASIFGHIASAYYLPRKTIAARILDQDYPTLVRWAEDVKNELFPDDFTQ